MIFTKPLSWKEHISYIIGKASKMLNFVRRNIKMCPVNVKKTLYLTNIRQILEYACVVWDPYQLHLRNQLESIQNKAARFIYNNCTRTDSKTSMKSVLDLPSLESRRRSLRFKLLLCTTVILIVHVLIKRNIYCHHTICHVGLIMIIK